MVGEKIDKIENTDTTFTYLYDCFLACLSNSCAVALRLPQSLYLAVSNTPKTKSAVNPAKALRLTPATKSAHPILRKRRARHALRLTCESDAPIM